ncbi:unnamed protein product [Paramecium octaurelia]|uniref:Uncharacterized protein n=1 Tax=Paramecium octaurelia TaxID=43137 RepID=A0A8S1XL50_PAROT|nr:unnamed protein product [Paramecium octaurelia]
MSQDLFPNEPNLNTANDVEQYIKTLLQYQDSCEKSAEYMQADAAQKRIVELKKQLVQRRRKEMQQAHYQQEQEIERAHLEEFNQFNRFWDEKMQKFNDEASAVEQELLNKQQNEFNKVSEELERTIPSKPKESSDVLNLKKREEYLAKQKKYPFFYIFCYVEAQKIKEQRVQIEDVDYQKYQIERTNKINTQLKQLRMRYRNEINALQQRIKGGQDEQKKNRTLELEKLLQKYQNIKKELEIKQKMDKLAFEGQFTNKGSSNQSVYMSQM